MDSWVSHYLFCGISFAIGKNLGPTVYILSHDHNGYYVEEESGIRKREKLRELVIQNVKGGGDEQNPYLIS